MALKLGFVGLGEMGKWMAINMSKAGFPMTVYDVRHGPVEELVKHGAISAATPADVARNSECVFLSLPDTEIVEKVIFGENGLVNGLSKGVIVADLSTINYMATLKIEKELKAKGVTFIDVPVSGQESRAKDATLTVMAGGDITAFEKIRPALNAVGNNIVHMGKIGNGQLTKLVNQLSYDISAAALAELLPMAVKLGLDAEAVCQVVTTGTGKTYALEFFTPYILDNNFKPGYAMAAAYKDLISAAEISALKQIPLPVTFASMQTYQMALIQGLGSENKGAMIKVFEKALGVEVRRKKK